MCIVKVDIWKNQKEKQHFRNKTQKLQSRRRDSSNTMHCQTIFLLFIYELRSRYSIDILFTLTHKVLYRNVEYRPEFGIFH